MLISGNAQKVLKILHLLAISYWIGGALALLTLVWVSTYAQNGDELYGVLKSMRLINVVVVVWLGAWGSFFTGLAYSVCTNRGFFRHKWVILKWLITIYMMVSGTILMGPWSNFLFESAAELNSAALAHPEFLAVRTHYLRLEFFNMALFVLAIVLSVFKPWELREVARRQRKYLPARRENLLPARPE